jgi:hypothetical protein
MKAWSVAGVLLVLSMGSLAQKIGLTRQSGQWSFELYPVAATFKGKPAPPLLTTDLQHAYRSRIRSETRKGPNFAGLFTLVKWGCGSPCLRFVIVDARSGAVYEPRLVVGCSEKNGLEAIIDFKRTSRLIIAIGHSKELGCGSAFYEWDGKQLQLVHFEPWPSRSD